MEGKIPKIIENAEGTVFLSYTVMYLWFRAD